MEALLDIAFDFKLRRYSTGGLSQLAPMAATVGSGAAAAAKGAAAAASSAVGAGGAADPTPLSTLLSQVRPCTFTPSYQPTFKSPGYKRLKL
jgi:hypothetical protein